MGATLEEVSIPLMDRAAAVTRAILAVESASLHHEWIRTRVGDYDRNVQIDFLTGALLPAQLYYRAQKMRDLIRQVDPGPATASGRAGPSKLLGASPHHPHSSRSGE